MYEEIKSSFIINSVEEKEKCKKTIGFLDTDKNYEVVIYKNSKLKTREQCAFFHSLLTEFVKVANNTGIGGNLDNNTGWWKYQIKKFAEFYDTKKGCLFTKEQAKRINTELNKLSKETKEEIITAMTMNVKSISQASTKELNTLINSLFIQIIVNLPQPIILSSEFISKSITEKYNDLKNSDIPENDNENIKLLSYFEFHLSFEERNKFYYLRKK